MPRVEIGLPQINLDAPRLLAHCFLFEIDSLLVKRAGVDYARYMDDMDIGVDSIPEAKEVLRDLDLALQTRQIRLNSGKTQILTEEEALKHFRIRDNSLLNLLQDTIERKRKLHLPIVREKQFIEVFIRKGLRTGRFEGRNGEKILKRCINYARQYNAGIDDHDFLRFLLKWPGVRGTVLLWWQHSNAPTQKLELIRDFVSSSEIVDDRALIDVAVALVAARLPANVRTWRLIEDICRYIRDETQWGFYAKTWILSKYGTDGELMRVIESKTSLWVTEEHLSRLVAGLYPRMIGSGHRLMFENLTRKAGNQWCQGVLSFHESISGSTKGFTAINKFAVALNPSQPNRISHSKFLMLCSLASNTKVSAGTVRHLKTRHAYALSDEYYRELVPP